MEVFHNRNTRDITLEIEDTNSVVGQLAKLRWLVRRSHDLQTSLDLWINSPSGKVLKVAAGQPGQYRLEDSSRTPADVTNFVELISALSEAF